LRIIPPGPAVPRIRSVNDALNLMGGTRIESGIIKLVVEDFADVESVSALVDGQPAAKLEWFQTDALTGSFEINLHLPAELARGSHQIELSHGSRRFPPIAIEVV
jgi:hypothetical protein